MIFKLARITIVLLFPLLTSFSGFSQPENKIHPSFLGVHFVVYDFKTPEGTYVNTNMKNLEPALAVSFQKRLTGQLAININWVGSILNFSTTRGESLGGGRKGLLLEGDFCIRYDLFHKRHFLSPFLQGGVGVSAFKNYFGGYLPAGLGLQINASKSTIVLLNTQYRIPITAYQNNHFYYSLGIAGVIGRKKISKTKKGVQVVCPSLRSDADRDGIEDSLDACPAIPGQIKYNGCPVPDTDGDGVNDELDSCLSVPGFARYEGCPIPDTDKDGVNDETDKCPEIPGTIARLGCPEIRDEVIAGVNKAAKNCYFETGSAELSKRSFEPLNEVARILQLNLSLNITVEGHTDNVGDKQANKDLSERRAKAISDYLIGKGISESRIKYIGYGAEKPIAENSTKEGRSKNRRVEIRLTYNLLND